MRLRVIFDCKNPGSEELSKTFARVKDKNFERERV